jgi:transcriptional antiterminator RfaH
MYENKTGWYLLTTKPKNEQRASNNLLNQGYQTYFPKVELDKIRNGKRTKVTEPLFPNYLFIKVNQENANFNSIRSTPGVMNFVRFGMNIAMVSQSLITRLKVDLGSKEVALNLNKATTIQPNDKVAIIAGPFVGLEAIYQSSDGLARSMLLLKIMNSTASISIANKSIEKHDD